MWRNKSDKVTLGNLEQTSSGGTLQPRHAAPCSDMLQPARQQRGAGRPLLVIGRSPAWDRNQRTNMAAFSSMAAHAAASLSLARCGLHTIRYALVLSGQVLRQVSVSLCVPGEAESEPSRPPSPPKATAAAACSAVSERVVYISIRTGRQSIRLSAHFSFPGSVCFLSCVLRRRDLVASCRLSETAGVDLSTPDTPKHDSRQDQQTHAAISAIHSISLVGKPNVQYIV